MEARSHLVPFPDPLSRGRNALSRGNWEEARVFFERALDGDEVPEALEGISWAAWWTGDAQALFPCRERAYHAYRKKGDRRNAARMALWMASDHLDFRGEAAVASGWRQRARRLLEGLGSTPEEGWLHVFEGAHALEEKADAATAAAKGARAVILGRETGVLDLEMMGLALEGFALVTMGRVDDGMRRLDQAVAAAVGGEFQDHAFVCWASCYLIFACEHVRDFDRAAQWCERMKEFSTRLNIQFFMGVCRAHYGGVLLWRGKWGEAEAELLLSQGVLASTRPAMVVEALVRIAELRRRQGRLVDAADLFRQSGHHPLALLGRAQMALDAGRLGDAEDLSKRMLRQLPAENLTLRASALEVLVRTYSAGGDSPQAMESLRDLRAIAATINTPLLKASAALCEGVAAAGEGNYQRASAQLEDALLLFSAGGGLFEAAQCRLELARSLSVLGRVERAQEEAQAAAGSFKGLGALRDAERAETLLLSLKDAPGRTREWPSSLTNRESEVLRLLAKGLSNREIAAALTLSEHTVHRHVSNILSKLDLPSRSAAAAFAARLGF